MAKASYAVFLRGVSPMNAKMPALREALEGAGFETVKTVLASGNVTFVARSMSARTLQGKVDAAMETGLKRQCLAILRPLEHLRALIDADPYGALGVPAKAKQIVTFLNEAPVKKISLPIERQEARIYAINGLDVFSAYVPQPGNPVFMTLLEQTFGRDITTRTWDTVKKVVASQPSL
jgi:uncharacterized protein (DUF1697 family)